MPFGKLKGYSHIIQGAKIYNQLVSLDSLLSLERGGHFQRVIQLTASLHLWLAPPSPLLYLAIEGELSVKLGVYIW